MAIVNWTRPSRPSATFTISLTDDEAKALRAVLDGEGEISQLRRNNQSVYDILDELDGAFAAAETSAA